MLLVMESLSFLKSGLSLRKHENTHISQLIDCIGFDGKILLLQLLLYFINALCNILALVGQSINTQVMCRDKNLQFARSAHINYSFIIRTNIYITHTSKHINPWKKTNKNKTETDFTYVITLTRKKTWLKQENQSKLYSV